MSRWSVLVALSLAFTGHRAMAGPVVVTTTDKQFQLSTDTVSETWSIADGHLKPVELTDKLSGLTVPLHEEAFTLAVEGRKKVKASSLKITKPPVVEALEPDAKASRLSQRLTGQQLVFQLASDDGSMTATFKVIGRDGTNYLRQELSIHPTKADLPMNRIVLLDLPLRFPTVSGPMTLRGAPLVAGNFFCGFEHPLADNSVGASMADSSGHAEGSLERKTPIPGGQTFVCSAVIGVARDGQMRRDFSQYLEHERAHPYRPFLHYNSWYDIGYFSRFDEAAALDVVNTYGIELVKKRGVTLSSFLFDDGWDDQKMWGFNPGFPNGFKAVREAAEKYGADPGVWLSPWGGYGKPKDQRLAFGKQFGYETNEEGFSLSGPKYFDRFETVCKDMIASNGVNQFKFDGTGDPSLRFPGSRFGSDFEAAIQLIDDLRAVKPDLFINLTTGTWPSPFWLRTCDSIWRGGEDHAFAGVGSFRQRWITYRDGDTYREIPSVCPLYPLNSLMLHGILYAKHAKNLDTDPDDDFAAEVHTYFATGTQLQEMYITPKLLTDKNWDTLAEAAKWSRENADTLIDSHWVGGDPNRGDVYGWASWSPRKAILVLRNPSDRPVQIDIDIATAFELPSDAARKYRANSPWADEKNLPSVELEAGRVHTFELKPFEVLSLDAEPVK